MNVRMPREAELAAWGVAVAGFRFRRQHRKRRAGGSHRRRYARMERDDTGLDRFMADPLARGRSRLGYSRR